MTSPLICADLQQRIETGKMMKKEPHQIARLILAKCAHLTDYEKTFLKRVPHIIEKWKRLTDKQQRLLDQIAAKTHVEIEIKPSQIKPNAAALMMRDLLNQVKVMSPADKKILRIAVITQRKEGIEHVNKNDLFDLFKRYCA